MSYYRRQAPNQKIGIITNPTEGLNEYSSALNIRDNQFSDCLDVIPNKDSSVMFNYKTEPTAYGTGGKGIVLEAIADVDASGNDFIYTVGHHTRVAFASWTSTTVTVTLTAHGLSAGHYFFIQFDNIAGSNLFQVATVVDANTFTFTTTSATTSDTCTITVGYFTKIDLALATYTQTNMGSLGFPTSFPWNKVYSSCLFATEAKNYVVFSCSAVKKLFFWDGTSLSSVVIPFYPTKLVSHANRVFALDDKNKLWWSKAGAFATNTDWYGSGTTASSVIEDSGYWTLEKERRLTGIGLIGNTLYIFGLNNIYAFSGYNYDTFALQVAVPDFGVESNYSVKHVTQTGNTIYFMSIYEPSGGDWLGGTTEYNVYAFDGSSYPTLISRPAISNNSIQNGILGSVELASKEVTHLSADESNLYVYKSAHDTLDPHDMPVYVYNIVNRTWWKQSGFNDNHTLITASDVFYSLYLPSQNRNTSYCLVSDDNTQKFYLFNDVGFTGNTIPFIITKAFSDLPTDKQTLSNVAIQFSAAVDADLYIQASFSTTADDDSFEAIKEYDHYIANGDIETLELYLPVRMISKKSHYRIKLEISNAPCYLYNIERRYRVIGRVR